MPCHSATSWSASKSSRSVYQGNPAHVLAIALQVLLLAAADGNEAVSRSRRCSRLLELVGVHRAAGAAALRVDVDIRIHEEPVQDELAAAVEEVEQRRVLAAGRGEAIVLLHADHRHAAALGSKGVTRAGVRLLLLEKRRARGAPLLRGDDVGLRCSSGLRVSWGRACRGPSPGERSRSELLDMGSFRPSRKRRGEQICASTRQRLPDDGLACKVVLWNSAQIKPSIAATLLETQHGAGDELRAARRHTHHELHH